MANSLINVIGTNVQTATFTANTYISAGSFTFVQIGKVVVFFAEYTLAQNISSSASVDFSGFPKTIDSKNFKYHDWDTEDTSEFGDHSRFFRIAANNCHIKGAHTAGVTYRTCGVYLA